MTSGLHSSATCMDSPPIELPFQLRNLWAYCSPRCTPAPPRGITIFNCTEGVLVLSYVILTLLLVYTQLRVCICRVTCIVYLSDTALATGTVPCTVQRHREGPDANGATHTERGPGPRKTMHHGTDPHTGQNGGQDTPGSDQGQNGRDHTARKQSRGPSNRRKNHKQPTPRIYL